MLPYRSLFLFAALASFVQADAARDFTLKVLPMLKEKCFSCHGNDPTKLKGKLNLLSRESMLLGGESGRAALVPGKSAESDLFLSVTWLDADLEMPPKENDRLKPPQIESLQQWIDAGAPWPSAEEQSQHLAWERAQPETADGIIIPTSGGLSDAWTFRRYKKEDVWAFRPVRVASTLAGKDPTEVIDALHQEKLAAGHIQPAPPGSGPRSHTPDPF
jgi:hypothetical protein